MRKQYSISTQADGSLLVKQEFQSMVTITIYGPQGCGKTKLMQKIADLAGQEMRFGELTVDLVRIEEKQAR